jgi:hypothetical protein
MAECRAIFLPNTEDIGRTFDFFYVQGAALELRILESDQGTISGYFNDRERFVRAAESLSCRGPATFVTINPAHADLLARVDNRVKFRAKSTTIDAHIVRRHVALIDCDAVRIAGISATDSEHDWAIDRLCNIEYTLRAEGFPEPATADSGNGGHGLFRLDLANDDRSRLLLQNFLKVVAGRFDDDKVRVDQSVYNAARIVKLYGTPVRKGDNLPNRPHRLSRWLKILEDLEPIPIELLEAFVGSVGRDHATRKGSSPPPRKPPYHNGKFNLDDFITHHNIETRPPEPYDGGRIFRLLACLFNPEHQAKDAAIIERADGTICYHCFHSSCSDRSWREVRELYDGPRPGHSGSSPSLAPLQSQGPSPSPPVSSVSPSQSLSSSPPSPPPSTFAIGAGSSGRPVINAGNYQLRNIIVESLTALRAANEASLASGRDSCALYTRGGRIVEIVQASKRTLIVDASDSMVRRHLSLAADYVSYTMNGVRGVPPPIDATRGVIDTHPGEEWGLPPVEGVVEVPNFRPDGTIIERAGYDPSTRLYYAPPTSLNNIRVPLLPTNQEVAAARELLNETFIDFPFVDSASRTNVIAALLTLFVRAMVRGCVPALALDATTQGSGKTLITKILAVILTGEEAILHAAPQELDEWRKKLMAILRYGPAFVVFDNVIHPLSSDAVSCAITSGYYADRILGVSESVEIPVRCLIVFTGNNLRAVGDMERRVFWSRLDPEVPDPENRSKFQHPDLEMWVRARRISLIEAVLTLVRAWFAAGQPRADLRRGSFEDWTQTIGGILQNAGIHHFLENRTRSYAADAEVEEFGAFLLEIKEVMEDAFLTIDLVKVLMDPLLTYKRLRDAMPDWIREKSREEGQFCAFLGNVFSKRIGKRNRPSGVYITRDGHTGGKARWKIVVPAPNSQQPRTDEPRDEDVPPDKKGGAPVDDSDLFTLNIKGRGRVSFPSQEAADAFRSAHPEVVE